MKKFNEIGLPEKLIAALEKNKYETLTPIQEEIIPAIQAGKDVLGCSQTGSGKTGAFLIPIVAKLIENKNKKAIVVAPTRELAMQIMDNAKLFTDKNVNKALVIGGASIREQIVSIRAKPRLIVGTPGRINDFLESGKLDLSEFDTLVLDEMDRMLDMGFSVQIDEILKNISKERQTMLFSATISKKIEKVTSKYLTNPVVVKVGETNQPSANITQEIIEVEDNAKFPTLLEKLKGQNTIFSIVFVKTKYGAEKLAAKLDKEDVLAQPIHGDMKQSKRARIIREYREKKFNVLVATDVAARGLDIHHIDTVVNYDLPQSPEDYIHRIGRCSRGLDVKGCSISFCSREDKSKLRAIRSLIETDDYDEADTGFTKNKSGSRRQSSSKRGDGFGKSRGSRPRNRSNNNDGFESRQRDRKDRDNSRFENNDQKNNFEVKDNSENSNRREKGEGFERRERTGNSERSRRSFNSDRGERRERRSSSENRERTSSKK